MKILDCTLRDGGYYNSWDFEPKVVNAYLMAVANAGIEFIELGLRNFPKQGFLGAFAYTTENFLNTLELPIGPTYGVMVDAKTLLTSQHSVSDAVDKLFVDSVDSKVGLVRVAAHFNEVEMCEEIVSKLKEKGYLVGFNLMQSGGKPTEIISKMAQIIKSWGVVDCLYFADSLGNMDREEVLRVINALRCHWEGDLGIHTHDNMSLGLSNSMLAIDSGVEWIDSTITGMGRGAGNTQTERLVSELHAKGIKSYQCSDIYELVIRHFEPMQKLCGWGTNLLYFIGSQNNVHPTYIQKLLSDSHYGVDEVVGAIDFLRKFEETVSFDESLLNKALSFHQVTTKVSGDDGLVGYAENREILIVANGPGLVRYESGIRSYISEQKPIVLAINALPVLNDLVDFYAISHNSKFLSQKDHYSGFNAPIILPVHRFNTEELSQLSDKAKLYDYGLEVVEGAFEINSSKCSVAYDLTAYYAFASALVMKPEKLSMVGFDGYEQSDPRQLEVGELFKLIQDSFKDMPLRALTPSTYAVAKGSVYEPTT
jgi:4-hydroxy 2-oxovalerate aldolase